MESLDWTQLPSTAAIIGAFIWGITKGLPNLIEAFKDELQRQRSDFRQELDIYRARHDVREEKNNQAVMSLSQSVEKVADKVDQLHSTVQQQNTRGDS